jgi:hypothetical protein
MVFCERNRRNSVDSSDSFAHEVFLLPLDTVSQCGNIVFPFFCHFERSEKSKIPRVRSGSQSEIENTATQPLAGEVRMRGDLFFTLTLTLSLQGREGIQLRRYIVFES